MINPLDYQDRQARAFAFDKHRGQMYGDHPYRTHLRNVQKTWYEVLGFGNDETLVDTEDMIQWGDQGNSVCWLHDIIEDTEVTAIDLECSGFDKEVVGAVVLLTKESGISREDYIKRLCNNKLAWTVKVADTHSNLTESIKIGKVKWINKYTQQLQQLFKFKNFDMESK